MRRAAVDSESVGTVNISAIKAFGRRYNKGRKAYETTGISADPARRHGHRGRGLRADPYVIYLSNNFVGNDWRQQMERVAEVSVKKGPLAGRVDLKIENVENTVQAQINSLNNIIRAKPDAILIDAAPTRRSTRRSRRPATPASSSSASTRW